MHKDIIRNLFSHAECDQLNSISLIGYAFEKAKSDTGVSHPEIEGLDTSDAIVDEFKDSLLKYLSDDRTEINRSSAFNALGKLFDTNLVDFYTVSLQGELESGSPQVLYQIMIALDNVGEKCFGDSSSHSMFDVDVNMKLAKKYLAEK